MTDAPIPLPWDPPSSPQMEARLSHWLPDGIRTDICFTEGPRIRYILSGQPAWETCLSRWLPDGVGTNDLFTEGPRIHHIVTYLIYAVLSASIWPHVAIFVTCCYVFPRFPMRVAYGKLRLICDDPVCPDPVWKPWTVCVSMPWPAPPRPARARH